MSGQSLLPKVTQYQQGPVFPKSNIGKAHLEGGTILEYYHIVRTWVTLGRRLRPLMEYSPLKDNTSAIQKGHGLHEF